MARSLGMVEGFIGHAFLAFAVLLAGCMTLEPPLPAAQPEIPAEWPLPPTTTAAPAPAAERTAPYPAVADIGWRDFFADSRLEELIARALDHNRDLRVAVLNIERARALYRIQRADLLPSVDANAALSRRGGDASAGLGAGVAGAGAGAGARDLYSVSVGADFEIDLFGRVRSLSEAALRQYFAQEEARRAAQLSLIAEVASAFLTLAADRELLRVASATLANQEAAFRLTQRRHELGAVSGLDLSQARTTVETARADEARFTGQVAQDTNALALLVGAPLDPALLPQDLAGPLSTIAAIPSGLSSEVLLRRPDVLRAEQVLRAANANIGAARAAFFPSIRLTGSAGTVSTELSRLFGSGTFAWTFMPGIDVPIFQGGRLRAGVEASEAERDIALAQYERAIQAGFREVADALALSRTLSDRLQAQQSLLAAAAEAHRLSRARYEAGRDSFLVLLDAQRTLYAAEQGLVAARLAEQANRVVLYKALGGGWREKR
jgi:multidrug efflux system outer membrane protein